ncbi:MAG: methylated-DNA--[protein]-cysteine S-methyltransferase [Agriterribacter sp.]
MITSSLYITYIESPVGILEIKADNEAVHAILFVNAWKGPKLDTISIQKNETENIPAQQCIAQLKEYFEGRRKDFDFPYNQEGTGFQLKVWNELNNIPFGKTISYLELSKRIGDTKAIRAVGTTNGKNQLSIVVPCHRVIGSNGNLVGYGGDLWRKKWLLDHEAKYANGVQTLGGW